MFLNVILLALFATKLNSIKYYTYRYTFYMEIPMDRYRASDCGALVAI